MFIVLLALLLLAWVIHTWRGAEWTLRRGGELLLLYLLVGYCGIPMLLVAGLLLVHPHESAHMLGVAPDHPFALFLGWAYLGMALIGTLALRFRGTYLAAPALAWAVFFGGATLVHVHEGVGTATLGHGELLEIFAAHGLVSVLLVGALWASGVTRRSTNRSASSRPAAPP